MNHPEDLIWGLIYAMRAVSAKRGIIAVKSHYPELKERLEFALSAFSDYDITVVLLATTIHKDGN